MKLPSKNGDEDMTNVKYISRVSQKTFPYEVLGTVDLITTDKVERSEFLYTLQQLKSFTSQRWFIAGATVPVILTTAYVFIIASIRDKRSRRHRRRR